MERLPEYERHELSGDYEDIKGKAWKAFVENLKAVGVVGGRKVILYEGKVLDGWQLYRGCIECDIVPEFEEIVLPEGMTVEQWVETFNDHRRHETQEKAQARVVARRERIAAARAEGQSTRSIAEQEQVSHTTVLRDLENSPGTGVPAEPAADKVKGKDGKQYPATQPPQILCKQCERNLRIGKEPEKRCESCKELRKPPSANGTPKPSKPTKPGKPIFDDRIIGSILGKMVRAIDDRAKAFGKGKGFADCERQLELFEAAWKRWQHETTGAKK